jgi:eukaryotic-like serine/threonine-protein kinase
LSVLNAGPVEQQGGDVVIDTDFSGGGSESAVQRVQESLLVSLNRKLGKSCFAVADGDAAEVHVQFDPDCTSGAALKRLEALPPEALMEAPAPRIEDVVRDPGQLRRQTI